MKDLNGLRMFSEKWQSLASEFDAIFASWNGEFTESQKERLRSLASQMQDLAFQFGKC